MLYRLPAVVLPWVILTHGKQVIIYHVDGGFDVNRDWAMFLWLNRLTFVIGLL